MQDHRVTLCTRDGKTVKDAFMSSQRSRRILSPAVEIISCTPRQIVDGFNAVFAEGDEHQSGDSGSVIEFVRNTEFLSPRLEISLYLLRQTSVWIERRGVDFDGVGQTCCLVIEVLQRNDAIATDSFA
jgi:hypothetical protein